jgi:hypothetical protein
MMLSHFKFTKWKEITHLTQVTISFHKEMKVRKLAAKLYT